MWDKAKGTVREVAGTVEEAVGDASGDVGAQVEGKVRQAAGRLQQTYGDALESFREAAISNPGTTLAVVAGVSFLFGALWARRD